MSDFDNLPWDSENILRRLEAGEKLGRMDATSAGNRPWRIDPTEGTFELTWLPETIASIDDFVGETVFDSSLDT